ncbi:MAG: GNAT family N-acetyltransferase [Myxococcota bacterium]|nr:GNAT family N-acetyltransferase [Myxococcota bacterium]
MATAPDPRASADAVRVRPLRRRDVEPALARLRASSRANLFLVDLVRALGRAPAAGEEGADVLGCWRGEHLLGVASARPTVVLDADLRGEALDALLGELAGLHAGLVRSPEPLVEPLWERLAARGRRSLVDRREVGLLVEPASCGGHAGPGELRVRPAQTGDLEALVDAARASLREEGRPDPFVGDPRGFRRWVRARRPRALVGEVQRRVVFVGYADVRLPEGWLLQGVYTWPEFRRRGYAAAGVAALCRAAFEQGADHVQLSVVEGNAPALRLYDRLGFVPFVSLRTLLFV